MPPKRALNYTTVVPVNKTVGECQSLLGEAGADAVAVMFRDKQPCGLSFRLDTPAGSRDFALPVNIDGVRAQLRQMDERGAWPPSLKPVKKREYLTAEHAAKVAWRVVKDWLEAQLAIIAAGMVTLDEAMLPYLEVAPGKTLYQRYIEQAAPAALMAADAEQRYDERGRPVIDDD